MARPPSRLTFLRRQLRETERDIEDLHGVARVQARKLAISLAEDIETLGAAAAATKAAAHRQLTDVEVLAELCDEIPKLPPQSIEAVHRVCCRALGLTADGAPTLAVVRGGG